MSHSEIGADSAIAGTTPLLPVLTPNQQRITASDQQAIRVQRREVVGMKGQR